MAAERIALTGNELVAYNLARARRLRGWTQEEAAERLQPYLDGVLWSKATFSAAERSVRRERVRNFDADQILAFARAFDLPVEWFFLPPAEDFGRYTLVDSGPATTTTVTPETALTAVDLVNVIRGSTRGRKELEHRLDVESEGEGQ